ncbi:MAG: ATP-dependent DNA helicase RecG [Bacilli bacterium]|nr:ATP-dependent DNA helicase RecG [Bacilli bacterium]
MKLTTSPRLNFLLGEMGIYRYDQVLNHLPRRYDVFVYTEREHLFHLEDKEKVVLYGQMVGSLKTLRFARLVKSSFVFRDEWGHDHQVEAWNRLYLPSFLNNEDSFTLQASYDSKKHCLNMIALKKGRIDEKEAIQGIYSLPRDYPTHSWKQLVERAFKEEKGRVYDSIPDFFRAKYRLHSREQALRECHFPTSQEDIRQGQRVLKYEEALVFSLKNQIIRKSNKSLTKDRRRLIDREKLETFIENLPYQLTEDQRKVVDECVLDMDSPSLMYRLLQGDVGTGKTLVAAILMYANHLRSAQSAIMAPTDALARQHYENLKKIYEGTNVNVSLLVGAMSASDRHWALSDLEDGTTDIIVGTHALFSKSVNYAYLGLAIIDEQHKFGVNQRTMLASKGEHADVLLMSATPIPRTLSLTIYGDLDVSTISCFPSKERKITTSIVRSDSEKIKKAIDTSLSNDKRIYIVAPMIEEDLENPSLNSVKTVYKRYNKLYPGKCVLMHGRMNAEEKEAALISFTSGLCPILIATSLIEVGIDVKKANLMVIHESQSFALSSLHQLRGRIGRDGTESKCLLAYDGNDEEEKSKLNVLVESNDGFHIAEEDLKRRGPGEMAGTRQSGLPDLNFANVVADFKMFECARDDATYILRHLNNPDFRAIYEKAKKESEGISIA